MVRHENGDKSRGRFDEIGDEIVEPDDRQLNPMCRTRAVQTAMASFALTT